ncbi:MAG: vWA domain-containing protein [Planctomycetaceae bacterium]
MSAASWVDDEILRLQAEDLYLQPLLTCKGRLIRNSEERLSSMQRMLPRLLQIQRCLRLPPACRLEPATELQNACGCAGFEDAPRSFLKPWIRIDQKGFNLCNSTQVPTFYSGLMVHECGHILFSRKLYNERASRNGKNRLRAVILNFLEDSRIEDLLRLAAPGFTSALHALRCFVDYPTVHEHEPLFHELPDGDKLHLLLFTVIQAPHLATPRMQDWTALDGSCVWQQLKHILSQPPDSEDSVICLAQQLDKYIRSFDKLIPPTPVAPASLLTDEPDIRNRKLRQIEANFEDAALQDPQTAAAELLSAAATLSQWPLPEAHQSAERLLLLAERLEQGTTPRELQEKRRFSLSQIEQKQSLGTNVVLPFSDDSAARLNADIAAELECLLRDVLTAGPADREGVTWDWGSDRRTIIETVQSDKTHAAQWQTLLNRITNQIAATRAVFRIRAGSEKPATLREKLHGQLDRRKLAKACFQKRIFCQKIVRPGPRPLALGLLLDESGSMCRNNKKNVALEAAALLAESARALPGIQTEVFSHTSTGNNNQNCLVRRLYGHAQPNIHGLLNYGNDMRENYDHQALLTAADLLKKSAPQNASRLLIVISDGMPYGYNYEGKKAVAAAHDAACSIRKSGTQLLAIAIEDFAAEQIYKPQFTLKWTKLADFPTLFRALLTQLLRHSATTG